MSGAISFTDPVPKLNIGVMYRNRRLYPDGTISSFDQYSFPPAAHNQLAAAAINEPVGHPRFKLTVFFFDAAGNVGQWTKVMNVIKQWERYANVKFERREVEAGSNIRIRFQAGVGPSHSCSGTQHDHAPAGVETMLLRGIGDAEVATPYENHVILHEFGHVLSLRHEHQSPATLGVLTPNFDNIKALYQEMIDGVLAWPDGDIRSQITDRHGLADTHSFSNVDLDSVMIYRMYAHLNDQNIEIEENYVLSKWDKAFMVVNYPRIGTPTADAAGVWRIKAALILLKLVDEPDPVVEDAQFTPLEAKYRAPDGQVEDLDDPVEINADANSHVRILNLYSQLDTVVTAWAEGGGEEAYIRASTAIVTKIRNIYGEWTHKRFLAAGTLPLVHSNQLALPVIAA